MVHVDDMVSLNPFEGASNRTAVMVLEKGKSTQYPVPYTVWRKIVGPTRRSPLRFTYDSTLDEVMAATRRMNFYAEPVDLQDPTSPWLTARPKALQAIRKVLGGKGESAARPYQAHAGAYTGGANAVYWVEPVLKRPEGLVVVRNLTEGAKIQVDEVTEPLEPDLLYPLLRGRDVRRWRAEPSALILITHEPGMRLRAIPEKDLQTRYPRTYGYLKRFEPVLRQRAAFKRYFTRPERGGRVTETGPFYSMFDVGDYTFAPWKVVWREVAHTLDASVALPHDGKPTVPDHTLILVECSGEEEANYLCAAVNSSPARLAVQAYIVLHPDPHILEHIRIPRYNPQDAVHRRLAELSQAAHQAARREDAAELARLEAEIDRQAAQVWGLSQEELCEIQRSLRELAGESTLTLEENGNGG